MKQYVFVLSTSFHIGTESDKLCRGYPYTLQANAEKETNKLRSIASYNEMRVHNPIKSFISRNVEV